jgi:hypothetical protein
MEIIGILCAVAIFMGFLYYTIKCAIKDAHKEIHQESPREISYSDIDEDIREQEAKRRQ